MTKNRYLLWMVVFSAFGFLFSGFLTFTKLVLGYCPLKEPCPIFLGQPACIYGFVLFTILLIGSLMVLFGGKYVKKNQSIIKWKMLVISIIGTLFAVYSTYQELFLIKCPGGCVYSLGLPTCIYGLVMFVVIMLLSIFNFSTKNKN